MMILNEVMYKFAELLDKPQGNTVPTQDIELIPNKEALLEIDGLPLYSENIFISAAPQTSFESNTDLHILKEKKKATESEDMIQKAHPKSVYVSNALGDGGLVENQNEQHTKIVQMINKLPTGQLINTYAEVVENLVKIANILEENGQVELLSEVDAVLEYMDQ